MTMAAALEKAGYSKNEMRAFSWANEFIKAGGSREQWLAAFDQASTKLRGGTVGSMSDKDRVGIVSTSLVNRPGGQVFNVPQKHQPVFASGRESSAGRVAAMGASARLSALTVLDKIKTHDGRPWGDVGMHELESMERDGALAKAIREKVGVLTNAQRFKTVRELVRPEEFEAIRKAVANV